MHEMVRSVVDMMHVAAREDRARWETGFHWIRHGGREAIVVDDYYSANPGDLPAGVQKDGVKFGAIGHDIGKTSCVNDPGIWRVIDWKITKSEWAEIATHVTETVRMFGRYETQLGVVIPREAYEYAAFHHEKLDGSGYLGLKAGELRHPARLAAVVDQIVSRCENREYRYARSPMSFTEAYEEVNAGRGTLYDADILDKIWELYKNNPYIAEKGYQWIFQNGHLHRI